MPSEREFRALLLAIEDDLSDEERKKFVFLLGDDVPRRIKDGPLVDIFTELINRGHISKSTCQYLVQIFESMKLLTVAYRIAQFEARKYYLLAFLLEIRCFVYCSKNPCLLFHLQRWKILSR